MALNTPTPHATYSSAVTQTVASTTQDYCTVFETVDDQTGVYQKTSVVTISIATPAVVSWTGHGLSINSVLRFTTTGALPTGLAINTNYYIISAGFGIDSFQISSSLGGAAINTSGSQSGVHTARNVCRFYVYEHGDYLVNISGLVHTNTNATVVMDIWVEVNGTAVPNSNSIVTVTDTGINVVLTVPLILDLNIGDYVSIKYRGSSTDLELLATAAQVTPTRPACPSMIVTVNKIGK